jgi:hypothetical protein
MIMQLNTQQREQIRLSLLRYCGSAAQCGLATALLQQLLVSEGFRGLSAEQLRSELVYLADKGLVAALPKVISPENEAWRITAAGRDFLAGQQEGTI